MSFQNQGFWMAKGSRVFNDGEMTYDSSSTVEPKRPHQWFMDAPQADQFPNKKQAVEVPNNNLVWAVEVPNNNLLSGILNSSAPAWGNASGFHSVPSHFTERLFDTETARTANFHDRSIQSISVEKVSTGRTVNEDLFGSNPSFTLSMSHTLEGPRSALKCGGIRKVNVSQVKDSDDVISSPTGHTYDRVDNSSISAPHSYNKVDDISMTMGLVYTKGDENILSLTDTYDRENGIYISMGQPYNKGDESNSGVVTGHTYSKVENNIISMRQTYNKADESSASMSNIYNKENSHSAHGGENNLSIGQSYNKGQTTIISFGGCNDDGANTSGRILPGYEFLMAQSSTQRSETPKEKDLVESSTHAYDDHAILSSIKLFKKKEEPKASKKVHNNSFPSNVRSLLSTGMLDGVPVKYIAWSREKELRGVIKGSGYQCGCQSCDFSKVVNAYEFERHAACKTKHPNNHIYFENGKTIYGIVQELRNTPQNMLFDVIHTITGSPINQKCFRLWKESFLAATRELQRIYGEDEGNQLL